MLTSSLEIDPRRSRRIARLGAGAAIALGMAAASSAWAQTPGGDVAFGKRRYQEQATCGFCHRWAGGRAGDPHSPGAAANLRKTPLDREGLFEVIRCGRPNTAMPHFDQFAWTKGEECYGMLEADVGNDKPPPPTASLQKREINAVLDSLFAKVVGKGPPPYQDCAEYFGAGPQQRCEEMKSGALLRN